ncbi:DUF6509 family protein [Paenibacillus sp. FJAT-26967]|uniref:DUF6509 family protein n=1 Tax=Paenibacillus sp. FJAT-26967 TaxID=1729690 RepID=UPI000839795F|nr:DUF6509 family protein [Paenibacillus sp. FJAT-26967]
MLTITAYSVEVVKDPFGILAGQRYEFILDIEVPEDDELYTPNGLYLRVIYSVEESGARIAKVDFHESSTDKYLDYDLEEDEIQLVDAFCKENLPESQTK